MSYALLTLLQACQSVSKCLKRSQKSNRLFLRPEGYSAQTRPIWPAATLADGATVHEDTLDVEGLHHEVVTVLRAGCGTIGGREIYR